MEDRRLLAGLIVDTTTDLSNDGNTSSIAALVANPGTDGHISLREAITGANNTAGADTIDFDTAGVFASPQTITLGGTELAITDAVTITGTGAANLTIDAIQASRIFTVNDLQYDSQQLVAITGVTLQHGNAVGDGGAIFIAADLTLINAVLTNNTAPNGSGGGVYNVIGTLTSTNNTIAHNTVLLNGGGVYNVGGTFTSTKDSIVHNTAQDGGGVYNFGVAFTSINGTIADNSAQINGGGVFNDSGTFASINSTIANNTAQYGGGVCSDSTWESQNTVIAGNSGGGDVNNSGVINADHTLIGDASYIGPGIINSSAVPVSQIFVTDGNGRPLLADNGGPTETIALSAGSPALNTGSDPGLTTDQRGLPFVRSFGSGVDIGAYERQTVTGPGLVVDTNADENDGDYGPGDLSLREAIGLANGSIGPDTITFDTTGVFSTPQTIALGGAELAINDSVNRRRTIGRLQSRKFRSNWRTGA